MLSLSALSDPTRRRIIELLATKEHTAGELVAEFDLSAPAISQHLKVLRDSKLVQVRVEGQCRVYAVNPAGFEELDAWLHRMHGFWSQRLDALDQALKQEKPGLAKPRSTRAGRSRGAAASRPRPPSQPQAEPAPGPSLEIIKMETP
jgi:DNA-binding transcriptional ArsR family regulator